MPTRLERSGSGQPEAAGKAGEAPRRKNYRLHQSKLAEAQRILGTRTETETIEMALDLVAFGERLAAGTRRARGRAWKNVAGGVADC